MKKVIFTTIIMISMHIVALAQEELEIPFDSYEHYFDEARIIEKAAYTGYGPYGELFTPKGTMRALIIFARFTTDNDQDLAHWPASSDVPDFINPTNSLAPDMVFKNLSDFSTYSGTDNRSMSQFYYEMSMGTFEFFGDVLSNPDGTPHCIEIDPTSSHPNFPYNSSSWGDLNLRVMTEMKQNFPGFDWSPYDLHHNRPNYGYDASLTSGDDKPDYVIIMYRYNPKWSTQPVALLDTRHGSNGGYSELDGLGGFTYNGYSFDKAGYTNCKGGLKASGYTTVILHEIAHELNSSPHVMGANWAGGNRMHFPASGWGMIRGLGREAFISATGWERWILGWINLTTGQPAVSSDIKESSDLQNGGLYTIRDFITTGDVIRIKIPNTASQYLWIENHQLYSAFDHKTYAGLDPSDDGEVIPEMESGLYMYIEDLEDDINNVCTEMVRDMDKVNGVKILNAQGNHDYWHSETAPATDGNYWGNVLFTFRELQDNPISGINPYLRVPDDYPNDPHISGSDGVISYSQNFNGKGPCEAYWIIRETNGSHTNLTYAYLGGVSNEASSYFNRRSDAFQVGDEVSLSGIVPALNYPLYDRSNHRIGNYYLNGLSVKIQTYNPTTGEFEVLISYDDFTVRSDKRWCGFIDLLDVNSGPAMDLVLDENINLTLDKSGTANRLTQHPVFGDFVNPTVFTMRDYSFFTLKEESSIVIENNSVMSLEANSLLDLRAGAKIIVKSGSTLKVKSNADLRLHGNACIEVESGGYICFESGANILLEDELSVINLRQGYISGVNQDVLIGDISSCITNPDNISFTGLGAINDFVDDTYIQNEIINADTYYSGDNIYMGRDVDPSQTVGDVIIQSGNTVILDAEGDITIDKGSEIETMVDFEAK